MKIGAEDKKKVIVMAVLLVVAIPLAIHSFNFSNSGSGTPAPATDNLPAGTSPAANGPTPKKAGVKIRETTLDPTLNIPILIASQKVEYKGGIRNIFHMAEAPPTTIPGVQGNVRQYTTPPQATVIPTPQIPLIFYGFSNRPGEPKKAFLKEGENIFVAVEGEVVERRYKIVKITNTFVLVQDILNNNQQTINLTLPQITG